MTALLRAWSEGDEGARDRLFAVLYSELHRLAHRYMRREREGHTLQTTVLVNEAYLRLIGASEIAWQDRAHFLALAAQMMRRILVDAARRRRYAKRGGGAQMRTFDEGLPVSPEVGPDLIAINDALEALAKLDPRKGRVVELRFFGGLSVEETAAVLKISPQSVLRDWKLAKSWLARELKRERDRDI
jgi:RNA polymerase sigma factor (TIGR02999 family)